MTSPSITTGAGDAKVKVIDAKSAQERMKNAKRDMRNWIGWGGAVEGL